MSCFTILITMQPYKRLILGENMKIPYFTKFEELVFLNVHVFLFYNLITYLTLAKKTKMILNHNL